MAKVPSALALGLKQQRSGNLAEAEQIYRLILQDDPDHADVLCLLGAVRLAAGRSEEAAADFHRAIAIRPDFPEAHNNLGIALSRVGRLDEAEASFRAALRFRPDYPEAYNNLGAALLDAGRLDEAEACFRAAVRRRPDYAEAHMNLGVALADWGAYDEAILNHERALRLNPASAKAMVNLGNALRDVGQLDRAEASYRAALRLEPESAEAHYNRGLGRLLRGDFEAGWRDYEWRWRCRAFPRREFDRPTWDGSSLDGRTILLHSEQGLGDVMHFIRFAAPVKARGGVVVVECPGALCPLLARTPGIDRLAARGRTLPPFDVQAPLMSLPRILETTLATIPADVPYIFPDPEGVDRWRRRLEPLEGFKIGVVWQGNPNYPSDRQRSFRLTHLAPIARIPGVRLVSLQVGHGREQLGAPPGEERGTSAETEVFTNQRSATSDPSLSVIDLGARLDESGGAFLDTAAVLKSLDLVIAPNTALAHLAGAMGIPVWVALPASLEWRWMVGREDSPWYPTMRLFRQAAAGAWDAVFERMAAELRARIGCKAPTINVEIAPGELIDKITILEIKSRKIADPTKLANIRRQLADLAAVRDREIGGLPGLDALVAELEAVNESIWEGEEILRGCERSGDFGALFVEQARLIRRQNERRAALKRTIDERLGSSRFEEKSYG